MKSLLIVFFSILLAFLISILPFKIRFMSHVNLIKAKGYYSIKILFFKVLTGKVYLENGEFVMENSVNIISDSMDKDYMKILAKQLLDRIDVKKIELYFTGGFTENSFASAIMCGSISATVQTLYSYLSQKYEMVRLYENIEPTFDEDNLELTGNIVISISLLNILVAILKSAKLNKKLKENRYEGK